MSTRTRYLQHHPVFNPQTTDKIRVVFDTAAKNEGQRLDSSLCTGPNLQNSLMGVLLRFRNNNNATVADVEGIFHQVRADTTEKNSKEETYQRLVNIFVATVFPCCASFAIKTMAKDNSENYSAMTIETVTRSFYVDDLLQSVTSEQKLNQRIG